MRDRVKTSLEGASGGGAPRLEDREPAAARLWRAPARSAAAGNRKVSDLRAQIRAAACRLLDAGARRRAERRVRLLAALLDGGGSPGIQV